MAETATSASDNAALTGTAVAPWPFGVIVRDISRGLRRPLRGSGVGHRLGRDPSAVTGHGPRPWRYCDAIAVAFGALGLIDRDNPDFIVLAHNPVVVASLLVLVALTGPAMVLADAWLDHRLPRATTSESPAATAYLVPTIIGVGSGCH